MIVEPLVQGAAGMLVHPPGYLRAVRELCDRFGVLLICDEVATGFGRTGTMFACEQEGVAPDLLCLAKGLTGGYLPLAATLATERIYEGFLGAPEEQRTFFHGHTYTGNPLACAAALASLDAFEQERTLERLQPKIELLGELLDEVAAMPEVAEVRSRGFMVGIDLGEHDPALRLGHRVTLEARKRGAIIRPLGDVVVLMPPLSISEGELRRLVEITAESIEAASHDLTGTGPGRIGARVLSCGAGLQAGHVPSRPPRRATRARCGWISPMDERQRGPAEAPNLGEPSVPRPAASVVLLRRGGKHADRALEVLLLKRTERPKFMPGVWVFPGGGVDPGGRRGRGAAIGPARSGSWRRRPGSSCPPTRSWCCSRAGSRRRSSRGASTPGSSSPWRRPTRRRSRTGSRPPRPAGSSRGRRSTPRRPGSWRSPSRPSSSSSRCCPSAPPTRRSRPTAAAPSSRSCPR